MSAIISVSNKTIRFIALIKELQIIDRNTEIS